MSATSQWTRSTAPFIFKSASWCLKYSEVQLCFCTAWPVRVWLLHAHLVRPGQPPHGEGVEGAACNAISYIDMLVVLSRIRDPA